MAINPTFSLWLNIVLAALAGIGSATVTDPTTQKIVTYSGVLAFIINAALHGLSSPMAGPLVSKTSSAPPKGNL